MRMRTMRIVRVGIVLVFGMGLASGQGLAPGSGNGSSTGSGISACSTTPPAAGAANSFCYDISNALWKCSNGASACTTPAQWVKSVTADANGSVSIGNALLLWIQGLRISYVDGDTLSVAPGSVVFSGGGSYGSVSAQNVGFAALDTGTRTLGADYYVWATVDGIKLSAITVSGGATAPSGYTTANSQLLGYFHNGKSINNTNA